MRNPRDNVAKHAAITDERIDAALDELVCLLAKSAARLFISEHIAKSDLTDRKTLPPNKRPRGSRKQSG